MDVVEPMEILTESQCMELLGQVEVGRLAISIMNLPEIYPVNFVIDRGMVVFRTAEGTKLAGAVLGTGVAFEIDGYEPEDGRAWSVMVKGRAVEIEKMEEVFAAADLPLFPWHNGPKHRFVRIEPSEITGRRFRVTR
jgi:nitroimidazol reductase NimA-like FMN-containing flavoprotein (pyridoxamine 5'-phosphate oxidase superfamily)